MRLDVEVENRVLFHSTNGCAAIHDVAVHFRDVLGRSDACCLEGLVSTLYAPRQDRYDDRFAAIVTVDA